MTSRRRLAVLGAVAAAVTAAAPLAAADTPTPSPAGVPSPSPSASSLPSTASTSSPAASPLRTAPPVPPSATYAPAPAAPARSAAAASSSPAPAPRLPVTVRLASIRPFAPQPGDVLRLDAVLHNTAATAISSADVVLWISRTRVGSRSEFDQYAATPDGPPPPDAAAVTAAQVTPTITTVPPHATLAVSVAVPVDQLGALTPWQVYELAVTVRGSTPLGYGTQGEVRTFLPWAPQDTPGAGVPTRLAWLWPLVDRPHRDAGGVWVDDRLAGEVAAGGRLQRLLAAGVAAQSQRPAAAARPRAAGRRHATPTRPAAVVRPVPVTWAVDPLLVEDLTAMSRGYRVRTRSGTAAGTGRDAAATFLHGVRSALADADVLGLPYADPDITAAMHSRLATDVDLARHDGTDALVRTVGHDVLGYAWPPGGRTDQTTLDALYAAGVSTVVLDSSALPPSGGTPNETPGAQAVVDVRDGHLRALLADSTLDAVVDDGARHPAFAALDTQRLLAELLMIQAERPGDARDVVLAPERRWAPAAAYAATLLSATGRVPWVQPITLRRAAADPVHGGVARTGVRYGRTGRADELPADYLAGVARIQADVDKLASILPGSTTPGGFDAAVLRLLSSGWRHHLGEARALRDDVARTLDATMARVHIASPEGSFVTLTSHSGIVPITVENELDEPVRVGVDLDSGPYVAVTGGHAVQTIPPHTKVPVDVHAAAKASGVFPVTVTLYTPDHRRYSPPVQINVRSTAYGATALAVTGGATVVLLVGVAVRLARRVLRARRPA